MLTKRTSASGDLSAARSANSGASCVQATVIGPPLASAFSNFASSARQSWRAVSSLSLRQPFCAVPTSIFIVSSHEHRNTLRRSSVILVVTCRGALLIDYNLECLYGAEMPVDVRRSLDLPPPFTLVTLREV